MIANYGATHTEQPLSHDLLTILTGSVQAESPLDVSPSEPGVRQLCWVPLAQQKVGQLMEDIMLSSVCKHPR
ncbi:hypothetical protein PHET_05368 [Paragonimus heterotremus]|uniref:Uncharacterized protein n=1 Tax=Paragonimus heterotremus TaxID=100268 RepID=A0A8J4WHX5_9TREM|nr:hypothetical protein PHET_05368 [Paragonimus heterotremus]